MKNHLSIPTYGSYLPVEITIVGKLPCGSGKSFLDAAFIQQAKHENYVEEYCEQSALIGKTDFAKNEPAAVYTFGVDTRDILFHRHDGPRVIIGLVGASGCILRFSLATPDEARLSPHLFIDKMHIVNIQADCMFVLRFNGTIYHQFGPQNPDEQAFFAVSVHTDEAYGLSGELLKTVLNNQGSIPLLTEPAPKQVMELLQQPAIYSNAIVTNLDFINYPT